MTQRNRGPEVKADLVCPWNSFILCYSQMANYFIPSEKVDFFFYVASGKRIIHWANTALIVDSSSPALVGICAFKIRCFMFIFCFWGFFFFASFCLNEIWFLSHCCGLRYCRRKRNVLRPSSHSTQRVCWCVTAWGCFGSEYFWTWFWDIIHPLRASLKWLHLKFKQSSA